MTCAITERKRILRHSRSHVELITLDDQSSQTTLFRMFWRVWYNAAVCVMLH